MDFIYGFGLADEGEKMKQQEKLNNLNYISGGIIILFAFFALTQNISMGTDGIPFWIIIYGLIMIFGVMVIGYKVIKRENWALILSGLLAFGVLVQIPLMLKFVIEHIAEYGNIFDSYLIQPFFITPILATIVIINSFINYPVKKK